MTQQYGKTPTWESYFFEQHHLCTPSEFAQDVEHWLAAPAGTVDYEQKILDRGGSRTSPRRGRQSLGGGGAYPIF